MMAWNSGSPGTRPVGRAGQDIFGDQHVFPDLEIEHADADKIGPVLEGVLEAFPRMNRPGYATIRKTDCPQ